MQKAENLSIEQCNLLVHQANRISFEGILPDNVQRILEIET
jgi:hypothetical protein